MELTKKQQEAQEMMNSIISKCWDNQEFKQDLISDPVGTIEKFTGKPMNVPQGKTLKVNDQTDNDFVHINIPSVPNIEGMELTDEQLEMVAGGVTPVFIIAGGALVGWMMAESQK